MNRLIVAKRLLCIAKSLTSEESAIEKRRREVELIFYDWAHHLGVTGAKEMSQMIRAMMKGKTLGEAADYVYGRIDKQKQRVFGDDLYRQMKEEGKIRDPRLQPEHAKWLSEHKDQK